MSDVTPMPPGSRINAIDSVRGFALAGIVLAHMVEQYIGAMPPQDLVDVFTATTLDKIIQGLMYALVVGKFFTLFSFLFGLSFFIQMDRAASRGADFRGRFIWRLAILLAIGFVHSLFYRGDILSIYAPLGVLLVFFYNVRSTLLLGLAAILILGAGRYVIFAIYGGDTVLPYGDPTPELPYNAAYFEALRHGSLWDVFKSNAVYGHFTKMEFQVGYFGRWYLTFAFFLVGLWAGRTGLFVHLDELRGSLKKTLWIAIACTFTFLALTFALFSYSMAGAEEPQFENWGSMFALTAFDLFNVSLSIIYLCGFLLIFRRPAGGRRLGVLAPYGRTALSNYVMQTLIGTFILFNWGLGYIGKVSNTQTFCIAFAIIALQVVLSGWWLKYFRFGPLEWLWRSGTYLKCQPMRRTST
jgi:uncharacterized protein